MDAPVCRVIFVDFGLQIESATLHRTCICEFDSLALMECAGLYLLLSSHGMLSFRCSSAVTYSALSTALIAATISVFGTLPPPIT